MSDLDDFYTRMSRQYDAQTITAEYLSAKQSLEEMNESIALLRKFVDDKKRYDELLEDAIDSISI